MVVQVGRVRPMLHCITWDYMERRWQTRTTLCRSFSTTSNMLTTHTGDNPKDRSIPDYIFMAPELIYVCDVAIVMAIIIATALLIFNIVTYRKP